MAPTISPSAVFAVTSQGRDVYSSMTRIAAASLRVSNPGVSVIVVCDQDSDAALTRARDPLRGEVDEWVVVVTPDGTPDFRNRFVKTRLRETLDGPFLLLDSDVLVRGDLAELFLLDADIAAAGNHSRLARNEQIGREDAEVLKLMRWNVSSEVYLNAGVVFVNDTPASREFCAEWHRRWLQSSAVATRHLDQPAMNAAVLAIRPRLAVLPARFNAQIKNTIGVVRGAVIWHYYSSVQAAAHTRFELLTADLVAGASLDTRVVGAILKSPHPWRRTNPVDDLAAARIIRRGRFDGWAALWLRREFGSALRRQCFLDFHRLRAIFRR